MSKPTIIERIGGYEFTWQEERLNILVSHCRVHTSDSRVTGELLIKSSIVEGKPIYPQTTMNFSSEMVRSRLVKSLSEKFPQWAWSEIIDQLCLAVIDRARAGEPVKELWTNETIQPPQFLLEPILYKGLPTIIFGEKEVCKSTLALVFYACLTLPWSDNPLGLVAPRLPVRTLLLDYEVDFDIVQHNAKRLQEGMGLPAFSVFYRRCELPLIEDAEQIHQHLQQLKVQALIVDSLGPAVGDDLKDPQAALRFTQALRKFKCASLILGQTARESGDIKSKTKHVFGSTFFEYYARSIWELRKQQEEGEDTIDIALFHTYCNLSRRHPPMGYRLHYNESGLSISSETITAPELVARFATGKRIQDILKAGPLTVKEIMETLELTRANADMCLKRLKDKGIIVRVGDKWGLAYKEPNVRFKLDLS